MTDLNILNLGVEYNNNLIHLLEFENINFEVKNYLNIKILI